VRAVVEQARESGVEQLVAAVMAVASAATPTIVEVMHAQTVEEAVHELFGRVARRERETEERYAMATFLGISRLCHDDDATTFPET